MNKFFTLFCLGISWMFFAQIPDGYYNGTAGLQGAALKTKLHQIISNGHRDNGYAALITAYQNTEADIFYEKDGTVFDMYSENPSGKDPYNFNFSQNCGNPYGEGDCYNREHIIPQSLFSERSPMRNDIHHVRATDGAVNSMRGSYPFGVVKLANRSSMNGSKVGESGSQGYYGVVFEPLDAFKGDVARMVLYFVTRYEDQVGSFKSGNMMAGNTYPSLQPWFQDVMVQWSNQDPVSPEEIHRNNESYKFQGNRNPFIDHPEFVNLIWNPQASNDTEAPTIPVNLAYSNITSTGVSLSWTASSDNVGVTGYRIYDAQGKLIGTSAQNNLTLTTLNPDTEYSLSVKAIDAAGNESASSNVVSFRTLKSDAGSGSTGCGKEDFSNMGSKLSSYDTRSWVNNGISWTATNARTDQTLTGPAIVFRNGTLTGTGNFGAIKGIRLKTNLPFNDTAGELTIKINGQNVGTAKYAVRDTITTAIENLNFANVTTIEIVNNSQNRVMVDDLEWICPQALNTQEVSAQNPHRLLVFPNPVADGILRYQFSSEMDTNEGIITDASGKIVGSLIGIKGGNGMVNVHHLTPGVYYLIIGNLKAKFIRK